MWHSESRRRARLQGAQTAYGLRGDPLWDGPDPEPEELDEECSDDDCDDD